MSAVIIGPDELVIRTKILNGVKKARLDVEKELVKFAPRQTTARERSFMDSILGKMPEIDPKEMLETVRDDMGRMVYEVAIRKYNRIQVAIESGLPLQVDLEDFGAFMEWEAK